MGEEEEEKERNGDMRKVADKWKEQEQTAEIFISLFRTRTKGEKKIEKEKTRKSK